MAIEMESGQVDVSGFTGYIIVTEAHQSTADAWAEWLQRFVVLIRTIRPNQSVKWRLIPECVATREFSDDCTRYYVRARITVGNKTAPPVKYVAVVDDVFPTREQIRDSDCVRVLQAGFKPTYTTDKS